MDDGEAEGFGQGEELVAAFSLAWGPVAEDEADLAWIRPSDMASWTVERRARDPGPRPVENQPRLSMGARGSVTSLELR